MSINQRLNITLLFAIGTVAAMTGCAVATDENGEGLETQDEALKLPPDLGAPIELPKPKFPKPQRPNFEALVEISAGKDHTCVRKGNGKIYCWGKTSYGQAGPASTTCYQGIPCVTAPAFVGIVGSQVELGYDHTCAVESSGQVKCWGANHNMQLGNGAWSQSTNLPANAQPAKFNGAPIIFSQVSAGDHSTCGIAASDRSVFCWGMAGPGAYPVGTGNPNPAPLLNSGGILLDRIDAVTTGFAGACIQFNLTHGLGTENYCFRGMTANGRATLSYAFDSSSVRVSTQSVAVCADKADGSVQCFGSNLLGELGNGTFTNSNVPVTVGGGMALRGVSVGRNQACALDASGFPRCWGNGNPSPVAVSTPVPLTTLAVGDLHACGLGSDAHIYCWGNNTYGQIGSGAWQNTNLGATLIADPL
jgi:hypothetical protein